jgi:hypothetical protein
MESDEGELDKSNETEVGGASEDAAARTVGGHQLADE